MKEYLLSRLAKSGLREIAGSREVPPRGLLRIEHGSHALFFWNKEGDVLVIRILHKRMLPEVQSFDED